MDILINQQDIICCVAFARSSLRRIGSYVSVVAPRRLASNAFLVIRLSPNPPVPKVKSESDGGVADSRPILSPAQKP
jgi:hypothetical protein